MSYSVNATALTVAFLSFACGSPDGKETKVDDALGGAAGETSTDPDDVDDPEDQWWPNKEIGFNPSNFGLKGMTRERVDDFVVSGECELQTSEGTISCAEEGSYVYRRVSDAPYSIFFLKSLTILEKGRLTTQGDRPAIIAVFDDVTIEGAIDVLPGTAGGEVPELAPQGFAGSGARGGIYCGIGGWGEFSPAVVLMPEGFKEVVPLRGGEAGEQGPGTLGAGLGGGAIQLAVGGVFTLAAGAHVSAPGGAGLAASVQRGIPGGGGSGGAILIEADSVVIRGTLAVNGGSGGGQAEVANGEAGKVGIEPALGGIGPSGFGNGGDGSSATSINGENGTLNGGELEGGGGGGAGWIRINTRSGEAALSGATLSPSVDTPCVTVGKLD